MLTSALQLDANYSLTSWLSLAEEAARRAGDYLAQGKSSERLVVADLERDVKLLADRKAEKLIISKLRKSTDFTIFSEEVGTLVGKTSEKVFAGLWTHWTGVSITRKGSHFAVSLLGCGRKMSLS